MPLNIDWQQILLHMFNVTILFFALYFILFSPIKKFIAKREQHFKDETKKGEDLLAEANEKKSLYEEKLSKANDEAEKEKELIIKEAEEIRAKYLNEAKAEAENIIESAKAKAKIEHDRIIDDAKDEIATIATDMAEKIILKSTADSYEKFLSSTEGENSNE